MIYAIKPTNYHLQFEPDLKTFTYRGITTITFTTDKPLTEITLDSLDLTIQSCIVNTDKTPLKFSTQKNTLIIQTNLNKGTHQIQIEFEGKLGQNLSGFYRSRVEGAENEFIATTQFEPADARRAFPCVDHPSYKATFDVVMIVDESLTPLSNSVVATEEKLANGLKKTTYETTPIMSTYLLYLGAGTFETYTDTYRDIQIRGVATTGKAHYTKFAVECAKKSLEYFETYFGIPYPLKKLDVIAVPDFAAGAMENWGAITFRENLILYYEESSSITTKQRIAEVMAHEVAHQWFGNLVTMKWWDDLWLNESFATFMAYKMVDHYWPEWNIWDEYVSTTVFGGMKLDSLKSSHPIKVDVPDITQANELFDEIAYDKGGSILRMIEGYLGNDLFRDGLREYIKTYAYQNTEAQDLWSCLEKVSHKPIVDIMSTQITQTGFPVIAASLENDQLNLKQSRFLLNGETSTDIWKVPMSIRVGERRETFILDKKNNYVPILKNPDYIVINENYNSFFISDYSAELLEKLGKRTNRLSDIEKHAFVHDLYNLTFAGKKTIDELVTQLTEYFSEEKKPSILLFIIEKLYKIYFLTQNIKVGESLQFFSRKAIQISTFEPAKNEHPYTTQLRSVALSSLSLFDDAEVKTFVGKKFSQYLVNENTLHPDLRSSIYRLAVWYDKKNYDVISNLYQKSTNQEEKIRYLTAIGNSKDGKQLSQTLKFMMSDAVRFNQIPFVLSSLAGNPYAQDLALEWLFANWEVLKIKSGGTINHIFRRVLKLIIPICGVKNVNEVKTFLHKYSTPELTKTFEQVLEELEINTTFIMQKR